MEEVPTTTNALPLTPERQEIFEAVLAHLNADRMRNLLVDVIDIHSPTGAERPASEFMAAHLRDVVGIDAHYQEISAATGNAYGEILGSGEGARLLLYSPIDTHIDPERDIPYVAKALREDMIPKARVDGDLVIGLGATNPKCMVAGLTEIVHAVKDAGVGFTGDLAIGFAGGNMPWTAMHRDAYGISLGVYHLLNRGLYPDFCVLMKPRAGVFPEEPGMCWFKVSVYGDFGYAGITRGTPGFRASIIPAATIIQEIEEWLPVYTVRNRDGFINPEGWISAVRAGDPTRPAFPPATTEIFLDVRISPRTSPAQVRHQFHQLMESIKANHPDFEIAWEMYGSMPGGATSPDNWIIQSSQRGFEVETGEPYVSTPYQAGQTDGTMIRVLGVPTARVGYPMPPAHAPEELKAGLGGMGVASIDDVMKAVRTIAYTVVDTLTRTREDVGV
ncbi:MAG: acetylornithine deacetylase [Actinobacteria bacterium]|jgi:acetylornithine deacetylase/succinyl-diaminopimelate desuccinylase-like protein|nr:acetylornithine deacetylase [Actinomycetota bacterium]